MGRISLSDNDFPFVLSWIFFNSSNQNYPQFSFSGTSSWTKVNEENDISIQISLTFVSIVSIANKSLVGACLTPLSRIDTGRPI